MSERGLIHELTSSPWALTPAALNALVDRARAGVLSAALQPAPKMQRGVIAVVPVFGIIRQRRGGFIDELINGAGASTEEIARQVKALAADSDVSAIVLHINSPGGSVEGLIEIGDVLFEARKQKPIIAVANTMAGSAAYWIASQATEVIVTPSGTVGSIGVLAVHEEVSKMAEAMGIGVTVISAGRFKGEGNSFEPLGDVARSAIQDMIDTYYTAFVNAVARGRGVKPDAVRGGYGEGRMATSADAVRLGLADRVATFDATVQRLGAMSPVALRALAGAHRPDDAQEALWWQAAGVGPELAAKVDVDGRQAQHELERERMEWAALGRR